MNNNELLHAIVARLVEADDFEVNEVAIEDEGGGVLLEIVVPDDQKGRVIGKQGRTIQALRTVFGAVGAREGRLVKVDLRMGDPPAAEVPPLDEAPAEEAEEEEEETEAEE